MPPDDGQRTASCVSGAGVCVEPTAPGRSSSTGPAPKFPPEHWQHRDWLNRLRFGVSLVVALAWLVFSVWLSLPWLADLANLSHPIAALFVLTFVAYVPGFMNAFL